MFCQVDNEEEIISDRPINFNSQMFSFKNVPLNSSMIIFNSLKNDFSFKKSSALNFFHKKNKLSHPENLEIFKSIDSSLQISEFNQSYSTSFLKKDPFECCEEKNSKKMIDLIFRHDFNELKLFLDEQKDLNLNYADHHGNSPLMLAAKLSYKHLDYYNIIKLLVSKGASTKFKDKNDISILEEALSQVINFNF